MKSKKKIVKKIKNLGIFNRELVIRLAKNDKKETNMYHLVLTRRRSHAGSRYDKVGYFEIKKNKRKKMCILGLNRKKIKDALSLGATFHVSVYKIIFN